MTTDPIDELRRLSASRPVPPPTQTSYLEKVRGRAYAITDRDVQELSEDEIFEATIGVAIVEGLRRLDAARAVLA